MIIYTILIWILILLTAFTKGTIHLIFLGMETGLFIGQIIYFIKGGR